MNVNLDIIKSLGLGDIMSKKKLCIEKQNKKLSVESSNITHCDFGI